MGGVEEEEPTTVDIVDIRAGYIPRFRVRVSDVTIQELTAVELTTCSGVVAAVCSAISFRSWRRLSLLDRATS